MVVLRCHLAYESDYNPHTYDYDVQYVSELGCNIVFTFMSCDVIGGMHLNFSKLLLQKANFVNLDTSSSISSYIMFEGNL